MDRTIRFIGCILAIVCSSASPKIAASNRDADSLETMAAEQAIPTLTQRLLDALPGDVAVWQLAKEGTMNAVRSMVGTALLWAALAALVYVPSSGGGTRAAIVATFGFVAFASGLALLTDGLKRDIVHQLRQERRGRETA